MKWRRLRIDNLYFITERDIVRFFPLEEAHREILWGIALTDRDNGKMVMSEGGGPAECKWPRCFP